MSSLASATSSEQIQTDYMNLLITQLRNQNPLEPMDNNQMATQLAQLSQLQQLENMNSNFANILNTTNMNYASSLLDRTVQFEVSDEFTGNTVLTSGKVTSVIDDPSSELPMLEVTLSNGHVGAIGMDEVKSVK